LQLASTGFAARKLYPDKPVSKLGYRPVNHLSDLCFDQNLIRLLALAALYRKVACIALLPVGRPHHAKTHGSWPEKRQ